MNAFKTSLLAAAIALSASPMMSMTAHAVDAHKLVVDTLDQAPDLSKLEVVEVDLKAPPFVHDFDQVAKGDRKSTRLNSSHVRISYAVFCLKKKKDMSEIY